MFADTARGRAYWMNRCADVLEVLDLEVCTGEELTAFAFVLESLHAAGGTRQALPVRASTCQLRIVR